MAAYYLMDAWQNWRESRNPGYVPPPPDQGLKPMPRMAEDPRPPFDPPPERPEDPPLESPADKDGRR